MLNAVALLANSGRQTDRAAEDGRSGKQLRDQLRYPGNLARFRGASHAARAITCEVATQQIYEILWLILLHVVASIRNDLPAAVGERASKSISIFFRKHSAATSFPDQPRAG